MSVDVNAIRARLAAHTAAFESAAESHFFAADIGDVLSAFGAHAPTDIRALCDEVDRLRGQVAELLPWAWHGVHHRIDAGRLIVDQAWKLGVITASDYDAWGSVLRSGSAIHHRIDAGEFGEVPL